MRHRTNQSKKRKIQKKQAGAWKLGSSTPVTHQQWGLLGGRLFAGEPDEWGTTRPAGDSNRPLGKAGLLMWPRLGPTS